MMPKHRLTHLGLIVAAISFSSLAMIVPTSVAYAAEAAAAPAEKPETVRPEIGTPLNAAQALIKDKKYPEALVQLRTTDAVAAKTPFETFAIERMQAMLAAVTGDNALAIKSLEAVIASGRLSPTEQPAYTQTLAQEYYKEKDFPKAISWTSRYLKEGGSDTSMRAMLIQSYYLNNDFSKALAELKADVQAQEAAGKTPPEDQLQMLASLALKQDDKAGYINALEKIVAAYPQKKYWTYLLDHVQLKPGFSDGLLLDVYRLKLAVGPLDDAKQYSDVAQLANAKGFSAEAKKILDKGRQSGIVKSAPTLPKTSQGTTIGQTGIGMVNAGYDFVTQGQFDKGLDLMKQGLSKGDLKRPDEAKLHTGIAYAMAGRNADAITMFKTVQGTDGTADLARYWVMQLSRPTAQQ